MKVTSVLGTMMVATALLLGACGGDDEEATPTPKASATATASPAPSTATPGVTTTSTAPAGPTTEAQGAFPELPLDQITAMRVQGSTVIITSTLAAGEDGAAEQMCTQIKDVAQFADNPTIAINASDGSPLFSC